MVLSARAYSPLQVISRLNFAAIRSHLLPCICSLLSLWLSEVDVTPSFSIATRWKAKCESRVAYERARFERADHRGCGGCGDCFGGVTMRHTYISSACQHARHKRCRVKCKFCTATCLCKCHAEHPSDLLRKHLDRQFGQKEKAN